MTTDIKVKEEILELIKSYSPDSIDELTNKAERELGFTREVILNTVLELQDEEKLMLTLPPELLPRDFLKYIRSNHAIWFWLVIILSISTTISVYAISETAIPLVYLRYFLGTIFVIYLPGFSLMKALFPTREIKDIERFALNIGMSLVLVPLVGLLLNYTPWGIRLTPIIISLLTLTVVLALTGLVREYHIKITQIR